MPYKWTLTSGNLPPGLSLKTLNSGRSGFLIGTPTTIGTYNWRYTVTDDTVPTPQSAYNDYTMTISSSMFMRGPLVFADWTIPPVARGAVLGGGYQNLLSVEEAGAHNSVFTYSVIEGSVPAWLTITVSATTNETNPVGSIQKYCYAYVNFSGTAPNAASFDQFRLRLTSSSGGFIDTGLIKLTVGGAVQVPTSFKLSTDKSFINEGESVTVTLTTTNQANNSSHAYKINGISSSDINVPLEGTITVTEKSIVKPIYETIDLGPFGSQTIIVGYQEEFYQDGTLTITAVADLTTEDIEMMNIFLPSRVQLGIPEDVPSTAVHIVDTSTQPAVPTFALSASAGSVQEGTPITVTLSTQNVPAGTEVAYRVSGVDLSTFQGRPAATGT
ncbi:MAG: hypothetical protein EBY03_08055, partial [Actinobacteria bacterium]|nr:hypothetical protein [Actinomycetota bacterium]